VLDSLFAPVQKDGDAAGGLARRVGMPPKAAYE
jgi:hypothetical protein